MRAVDTNVLVRLLVSDDAAQQRRVAKLLESSAARGEPLLVTPIVLAELAWVLAVSYGYPRARIADALDAIIGTPPFVVRPRHEVEVALAWYAAGPADFADYLVLAQAQAEGCTSVLTFDRALLKRPDCERP